MKESLKEERKNIGIKRILKKQKLKEKGITLIALVVTIIILLILAGVTLNIALSENGLFKRAQNAADEYKKAQEDEEDLMQQLATEMEKINTGDNLGSGDSGNNNDDDNDKNDYSDCIGEFIEGYEVQPGTCEIKTETSGYTEDQQFSTNKNMKWRIWEYDGNTLRLISNSLILNLKLKGLNGYNNGIYAINEICRKCYSNGNPNVKVANLSRSDIQKVSTYNYIEYKHESNAYHDFTGGESTKDIIHFGQSMPLTFYKAPKMWTEHDSTWDYLYTEGNSGLGNNADGIYPWEQEYEYTQEKDLGSTTAETEFKESFYYHKYSESDFKNSKHYDMLRGNCNGSFFSSYWIASRYAHIQDSACEFGIHYVKGDASSYTISRTLFL